MDWKEFFRPTIGKLILFLIVLAIFVPFIRYDNGIRCFTIPCPADTTGSAAMWLMSLKYAGHIYEINYSYLILGFIISYFVSCLIVSIFKKINKKNT
ncbi:MAG TPA: hypothetical protein VJI52_01360 [Candidatus Nanoarchaeia archaeon]|nr:hypothetical protein [Candidatus Nanoarchaeia archaeon]